MFDTLAATMAALQRRALSSVGLAEQIKLNIDNPDGEGSRTYVRVNEHLLAHASAADERRLRGDVIRSLEGIPLSLKDSLDQEGQTTTAGSVALRSEPPAKVDAAVVTRLAAAGAIFTGRTNMTEFAFSALGLNPHYGTPLCPFDRSTGRAPGGSSAGAAVSVGDDMAIAAVGTDTGGSVRIPAALCGLVGFKPTARRIPQAGVFPLASSLDSVGSIGRSVDCCARIDRVMASEEDGVVRPAEIAGLRLLVPSSFLLDEADAAVTASFERAVRTLRRAGAVIVERPLPGLAESLGFGAIYASEAWRDHQGLIAKYGPSLDPRVAKRIAAGARVAGREYEQLLRRRQIWAAELETRISDCAAVLMPTAPMIAPALAALEASDDLYSATNQRIMRNARIFNLLDGCAVSIPCHEPGEPPVGLMIGAGAMADGRVLSIAMTVEALLVAS